MIGCKVSGCDKPKVAKGYCSKHYQSFKRTGDPIAKRVYPESGKAHAWIVNAIKKGIIDTKRKVHRKDCLVWPFYRMKDGRAFVNGYSTRLVSRIVCEGIHGPAPQNKQWALHNCGKGHLGCVEGTHLYWGTPKENQDRDRRIHDTLEYGERNSRAKLTLIQVRGIITKSEFGWSQRRIAGHYHISQGHVSEIITGKKWAHLRA